MNLNRISEACKDGYVLAVYRSGVEFGVWHGEFPWKNHKDEDLLELHIFDAQSEYRAVSSDIAENGWIEAVLYGDKTEHVIDSRMQLYGEEFAGASETGDSYAVKENGRKHIFYLPYKKSDFDNGIYLLVRNYYDYDENDLLYLSGYRLMGIEIDRRKSI